MSWWQRVLGAEQPVRINTWPTNEFFSEVTQAATAIARRDIQFSPNLSVMLAHAPFGMQSQAGTAVTPDTALRFSAVLACVRVIAEDVASLPLPLYRRLIGGGKERTPKHPLYSVLHDSPNPEMTSFTFRETMMTHLLLWGNAYAEVVWDGWPRELWPITPSRVSVRRNRETQELEYVISPPDTIEKKVLRPKQIMHIPGLSMNGIQGMSPIGVARDAIGLGLAGQEFASGFFARGMRPSMVFEHPQTLSQEALTRLRNSIDETYAGLTNAQRALILEEGMKANSVGMPLEDAQFIEQRKLQVEEIARIYRVQPHKIGHHERSTFNNIEHLGIDHVVSTIRPWLVRWEQAIAKSLIPPEERGSLFAEFVVEGLLRGDAQARSQFYKAMFEVGAFSPNMILEKENMNPIEGGDTHYVPMNYAPVGWEMPEPEPVPAVPSQNGRGKRAYAHS